jgi:hypothetical protein
MAMENLAIVQHKIFFNMPRFMEEVIDLGL